MTESAALRLKTYSYLKEDNDKNKKAEGTKNYATKQKIKFEDFKNCPEANELEKEINY